jgi:RNA polymerase sigma-70 factor (ECF subfamily)
MDEAAKSFLRYVRPLETRLSLVAQRYVARREDARDLVQETLLRAWRDFSPSEGRTYRAAWLFVIMRNVVFDWQRTARRRIRTVLVPDSDLTELAPPDPSEPFAPLPAMDEASFREFLDETIVAAFDKLPPAFREVVVLSVAGGLNYREIAEVLDRPVGTVMSGMARARRALREALADFTKSTKRVSEGRS